jgi:hypothetical protein
MSPHRFASLCEAKAKQWGRINPLQLLFRISCKGEDIATTYGAIANISCKAELIPYSCYFRYSVRDHRSIK